MKSSIFTLILVANSFLQSQDFEIVGPPNNYGLIEFQKSNSNVLYIANRLGALSRSYNDGEVKEILHPGIGGSARQLSLLNTDTSTIFFNTSDYLLKSYDIGENWIYDDGVGFYPAFISVNPLNDNSIYKYKNNQIFKSYDKGNSWSNLITFPYTFNYPTLVVAPSDTSIIYTALSDDGFWLHLFKSTNSGADWFEIVYPPFTISSAYQVDINPYNSNSLYISTGNLIKSTDGGNSFFQIGPPAISGFTLNHQDTSTIYFASEDPIYYPYGLFVKSTDEGQTWFPLNENFPKEILFNAPVLNPVNAEELYVTSTIGTFKSTNGGNDWKEVFLSAESVLFDFYVDANDKNKIITTNSVYGFKMTTDAGLSWFIPIIDTIAPRFSNVYYQFAFNSQNLNDGFLTSDKALYQTFDGGLNWIKNNFSYSWSKSIAISPSNPSTILICTIDRPAGSAKLYLSQDGGDSWELRKELGGWYFGFKQMIFEPAEGNKIYLHMHQGDSLLVTTDLGLTWKNAGVGLSNNAFVTQIWINPNNPLEMYCTEGNSGTYTGAVSMSTNGGESWSQIDSMLKIMDSWCNAQAIWVDPENTNRIYIGLGAHSQFLTSTYTSGGIYFSDNHGQSWMKIFDSQANMIKSDNSVPRKLYFNTKYGLLRITDTLVTSVNEIANNLPKEYGLTQNFPNPFNPTTTIKYEVPQILNVKIEVFDVLGRIVKVLVDEQKTTGFYEIKFDASSFASGIYYYRIKANEFVQTKKMILIK
ncbi:MAG: T9SS type A sorting domain-containing protein [Ignavibacteriaceae bacterium]